jgi:hypothetical protein
LKVYGQLERAQAELLAADPTGAGLINGRFYYNTVTNKLSFYDGAVRQVVSENGTATLTNKTLTGNIAGNFSPDGVETLTLPAVTDTLAVLAAAQTLENKSLPTISFPHQVTPATPAAGNSKLYVKSDRKAYLLDEEGNEIAIGTGGGGLDIYHTEDFSVNNASDMSTGNNATFLGGGSIAGSVSDFTDSEGNRQLRYTQAAGSLNDYFAAPAFAVPVKARGNKTGAKFVYTYTGNDVDVKPEIYDVTNGASLVLDTVLVKATSAFKTFEIYIDVPSTCAQMRLGFQTKVENIGAVLTVDDFQFNADALAPSEVSSYELVDEKILSSDATSNGDIASMTVTGLKVGQRYFVTGSVRFNGLISTSASFYDQAGASGNILNAVLAYDDGGGQKIENRAVSFSFVAQTETMYLNAGVNGSNFITGNGTKSSTFIQVFTNQVKRGVSVRGFENVDNENVFKAVISNNGTATVLSESHEGFFTVNRNSQGVVQVDIPSGVFVNELPHITATVSAQAGTSYTGTRSAEYYDVTSNQFFIATKFSDASNNNLIDYNFTIEVSKQGADFIKDHERTVVLPNGLQNPVAYIKDVKQNGTDGGAYTGGTWATRDLNNLTGDTRFVTLESNYFKLPVGEYDIDCDVPGARIDGFVARLQNVTQNTTELLSNSDDSLSGINEGNEFVRIVGRLVVKNSSDEFEIQINGVTSNSSGLGFASSRGTDETYTQLKITKRS